MALEDSLELLDIYGAAMSPDLPTPARNKMIESIAMDLNWKSQSLLCKDPPTAYMSVTGLPRELVDHIIKYVGLLGLEKVGYERLDLTAMHQKKYNLRTSRKAKRRMGEFLDQQLPVIRCGIILILFLICMYFLSDIFALPIDF